jgi:hypothetical protein
VVTKLVEAFSLTMHGEIFNCDPHPGNLLVERGTSRLVILDWGQASFFSFLDDSFIFLPRLGAGELFLFYLDGFFIFLSVPRAAPGPRPSLHLF